MNKTPEMLDLEYPQLRANLDLCDKQLFEICSGNRTYLTAMSVPPRPENFDMQFAAAFAELKAYREAGFFPEELIQKRAEKTGEERYVLTLTRDQAITTQNALELYARLRIGQFERIPEMMLDFGSGVDDYCKRRDLANDLLKVVACIIYGKNTYGWPDVEQDKFHHRAWNIYATLRYHMAWHDNPEGGWEVCFDKPYPWGGEPVPECRVEDNGGTP